MERLTVDIINKDVLIEYLERLINKTYKILPLFDEGYAWREYTKSYIVELNGFFVNIQNRYLLEVTNNLNGIIVFDIEDKKELKTIIKKSVFQSIDLINKMKHEIKVGDKNGV